MHCCICKKGPQQGVSLFRVNKKGVAGIWTCEKHISQTDAPPIDSTVKKIADALGKVGENS